MELLTGARFGFENDIFFEPGRSAAIGHAFVAIDPAALVGGNAYFKQVETLIEAMLADARARHSFLNLQLPAFQESETAGRLYARPPLFRKQ